MSATRRGLRGLLSPGRWSRTALILVPVHLIAFVVLYLGLVRLIQNEVLASHSFGARIILAEAVHTLHPIMCSRVHGSVPSEVLAFARAHELLDLRIYRANGSLVGNPKEFQPAIREFLASGELESFTFDRHTDLTALQGIMRIESEGNCTDCHPANALLGAATMHMDMTPEVSAAHDRLKRNLVFMVGGWFLAVGLVNIGVGRWTRRSLAHIRRLENEVSSSSELSPTPSPGVLLDPVAAELYTSLTAVLRRQQAQRESVTDRMHHTERLASLGQLAAGLAHEIKNPLAGIRGVMELMRDEALDQEEESLFQQVVGELDRVNHTIQLLLNFARPLPPRKETSNVAQILEEAVTFLRPGLAKQSIDLELHISDDVGEFALDPGQIRQIITNLVTNAADALEADGAIAVRASTFPGGSGLIIAVRDNGPGMTSEALDRIFEPFYTTKFSGTGLGLAVVRSLVHQHGGRIDVESEPGQGTTFFIVLPEDETSPEAQPGDTDENG